jgi:hypothetical protein
MGLTEHLIRGKRPSLLIKLKHPVASCWISFIFNFVITRAFLAATSLAEFILLSSWLLLVEIFKTRLNHASSSLAECSVVDNSILRISAVLRRHARLTRQQLKGKINRFLFASLLVAIPLSLA